MFVGSLFATCLILLFILFFYFSIPFKVRASVSLKSHGMVDSLRLQEKT